MMRIPALCLYVLILSFGLPAFGQEPSPPETVAEPEPISLPCPEGFTCQEDGILVALITQLDQTLSVLPTQGPAATLRLIREMQATQDPRLVPVYERLLRGSSKAISLATLQALAPLSALPQVERIAGDLVASTKFCCSSGVPKISGCIGIGGSLTVSDRYCFLLTDGGISQCLQ